MSKAIDSFFHKSKEKKHYYTKKALEKTKFPTLSNS